MMKIYIAGVMQGSEQGKGIQGQGYRQAISEALKINHPDAEIYDPYLNFPNSVEYDDQRARETLFILAAEAGAADIVIAYLPEASMGTALEMVRAYDNGVPILTISPMAKNWFINALSTKVFPTLEAFCEWARKSGLGELVDKTAA
jgi:hypothetical protein